MPLATTTKAKRLTMLGNQEAAFNHIDVTEYAAGGFAPPSKPPGVNGNLGIVTVWQETADRVLRWNATTGKVEVYIMSTGVEAGAIDVGEFKFYMVSLR